MASHHPTRSQRLPAHPCRLVRRSVVPKGHNSRLPQSARRPPLGGGGGGQPLHRLPAPQKKTKRHASVATLRMPRCSAALHR